MEEIVDDNGVVIGGASLELAQFIHSQFGEREFTEAELLAALEKAPDLSPGLHDYLVTQDIL